MSKKKGHIAYSRADIDSSTINKDAKTFDVVFATENPVIRNYYWAEERFHEVLVCNKANMRTERLDAGVVPLLDAHNNYSITNQYGIVRSWSIKNGECRATIEYTRQESKADLWADIEGGILRSISVGPRIYKYERVPNPDDPKGIPTYRAIDWEVMEVSMAPVPVDYLSSVRGEGKGSEHEIEILNFNRSVMTAEQIQAANEAAAAAERKRGADIRAAVRAAKLDEQFADSLVERGVTLEVATTEIAARKATPPAPTTDDAVRMERERSTGIRTLVRTHKLGEETADDMVTRGITLDAARTEILDLLAKGDKGPASGGSGGARAMGDEKTKTIQAMVEGVMHRAEPGSVEAYYKLDKATANRGMDVKAHDYKYLSLLDISRAILEMNGVSGTRSMSPAEIAKRAMDTTDLPDLFTSVTSRFLRNNYEAVVPDWKPFSRQKNADDFRQKTGIKVDANVTFELLEEGGEYKSTTIMSNEKAVMQLQTYARRFGITRKTIVNDDLGVIPEYSRFIGLGAAQFQSKKVWGLATSNAVTPDGLALFHATHNNLATGGAASVINDAALSAGRTAMRRQKSPEGNELMIRPMYLLVPPELETKAQKLLRTINPDSVDKVNIWGSLTPVVIDYFADTQAWYLFANPAMTSVDGLIHSYLNGQEGLYTESYIDKDTDSLMIKARLDFDARVWGHQGMYKNTGASEASGD